ncbi:MAG: GNAT family N-acetyltransferase [Longimicrobiales bacterium]
MMIERAHWLSARDRLEALFEASFGRAIQPGYLDWRYFDNGQEELLFSVEVVGDEFVSSYSAFPVEVVCDGVPYRTVTSMTTMTHPDSRGRGLFPKLASALYAQAEARHIACVWGFPNANSHPVFKSKLGWTDIYEIPTMWLCVGDARAGAVLAPEVVTTDHGFALDYPEPPNDGLIRVRRSRDYLDWRYARHPFNNYRNYVIAREGRVSSYIVTKIFGGGVDLVDVQASNPEDAKALVSHITALSRAGGLERICCWAPTHDSTHTVLERLGFRNGEPVTYFGAREFGLSAAPAGWSDYRRWHLQMGDSDVY